MHIELDDELVAQIDELSGPRVAAHLCVRPLSVQFARNSDGPTSKQQRASSRIKITSGIPTLRLGCGSSAAPTPVALGDLCFAFSTPLC